MLPSYTRTNLPTDQINPPRHPWQTLYKNRLCKCKPRAASDTTAASASGAGEAGAGDDTEDIPAEAAKACSELIGLCHAWEKDAPLASLALEGALCCLRSLKGRPSAAKGKGKSGGEGDGGGGGGGEEATALEGALEALGAAVGNFFVKKRGGGFTPLQV